MTPPVVDVAVGDWVRIRRGGVWLVGEVVLLKRHTAHVRCGDDFLGYRVFAENLKLLRSQQPEGGCSKPAPADIDVREETDDGDE